MQVQIGNVSLEVEVTGSGAPALVFLHYWGGTHRTWKSVAGVLEKRFQVVTYDMRGWGFSGVAADSNYSLAALADEAVALIDRLGITNYVLVGHSMGGKVGQLIASRHPAGLAGLVLVAPATPTPSLMPEEAKQQQLHAYDNRETVLQTISFLSSGRPSPEIIDQIVEDSLSGAPGAKLAWPNEGMVEDISAAAAQIRVPTIVIAAELDNLDSIEQHRREIIARIPGATLEIIPDSGHLLPIDEPVRTAEVIQRFVEQNVTSKEA
jgi:pimeloyl-ACP methyl ester carboxylesterase